MGDALDDIKFRSVEEYYEYMAQANCFAPKYERLSAESKEFWVKSFDELNKSRAPASGTGGA